MSIIPVLTKQDLIHTLVRGCKSPAFWRIGTEHEKFLFTKMDDRRLPYEGEKSIKKVLEAFIHMGWQAVYEKEQIIALRMPHSKATISLEPGGQFELSGAPLTTLHETYLETEAHFAAMTAIGKNMGLAVVPMGFDPLSSREDIDWMPKSRYDLMRRHMPEKGKLGIDMMLRTCTVQVNLDYESEHDMVAKMRVGMALQSVISALFASSPLTEGKPNGYKSFRNAVWHDTDPERSGLLEFVFEEGMGFERYVDYMLDVPMYFVHRRNRYLNALGASFSDFMAGELADYPGQFATQADWADHLTVAFPEVRLKTFIEMRGADAGPKPMLMAFPAIWTGLLYDRLSLDEAQQLIRPWSLSTIRDIYEAVPIEGLETDVGGRPLKEVAKDILAIAQGGLVRRHILNQYGRDESVYLKPLYEIIDSGKTIADRILDTYHSHNGDMQAVINAFDATAHSS